MLISNSFTKLWNYYERAQREYQDAMEKRGKVGPDPLISVDAMDEGRYIRFMELMKDVEKSDQIDIVLQHKLATECVPPQFNPKQFNPNVWMILKRYFRQNGYPPKNPHPTEDTPDVVYGRFLNRIASIPPGRRLPSSIILSLNEHCSPPGSSTPFADHQWWMVTRLLKVAEDRVDLSAIVGKTVERVDGELYRSEFRILFKDGSWCAYYPEVEDNYGSTSVHLESSTLTPEFLKEMGFVTPEDFKQFADRELDTVRREQREEKIAQFRKLQKELGI